VMVGALSPELVSVSQSVTTTLLAGSSWPTTGICFKNLFLKKTPCHTQEPPDPTRFPHPLRRHTTHTNSRQVGLREFNSVAQHGCTGRQPLGRIVWMPGTSRLSPP
jgi:hypothetical protein